MVRLCYLSGAYVSYGKAAHGNRMALRAAGAELVATPADADVVVLHDDVARFPDYFARHPRLRDRTVVGYCVWEVSPIPGAWRAPLRLLDEVWTPSRFSQSLFEPWHERVFRVPHLVARRHPPRHVVETMARRLDQPAGRFRFYTVVDAGNPRKHLDALLAAFAVLRQERDDVQLSVKQYARLRPELAALPGVVSIADNLSEDEMAALHLLGDCYVSPHRAEAWGLGMSEAMAHGRPVVATAYSGNLDFMSDHDAYPVAFTLRPVGAEAAQASWASWEPEMEWAEIDAAGLLAAMRTAHARGRDDERRWRATAICERHGLDALTACMAERLARLGPRPAAGLRAARGRLEPARPAVGMFHAPPAESAVILGRERASSELVRAYARHGRRFDYALFAPADGVGPMGEELGAFAPRVSVHERRGVRGYLTEAPLSVWHDIQLDTFAPFALRSRAPRPFPVTVLHHSISYSQLIHSRWLRLLLARPMPYDALICSSAAAERSLRLLLDRCAQALAAQHGTEASYSGRLVTIPLGVDTTRFRPGDPRPGRARLGIDADTFVILSVGRLSAADKADPLPLLQTFADLTKRHNRRRLALVLCGTERAEERVTASLREHAAHLGIGGDLYLLTDLREGLEQLYQAADVVVSLVDSLQESFGLSVVEAMASGVPQVVSDWNGHRETVVHGETGLTVPTYWAEVDEDLVEEAAWTSWRAEHLVLSQSVAVDLAALTDALSSLITDEPLRRRLAASSRRRALDRYDWSHVVAAHEALWAELYAEASRHREPPPAHALDYGRPAYVEAFGHYATRLLGDEAALALTARGRGVATGELAAPTHHHTVWRHLDMELMTALILALERRRAGATMASLIDQVGRRPGSPLVEAAAVRRHVLWLLKYGLVAVAEAMDDPSPRG